MAQTKSKAFIGLAMLVGFATQAFCTVNVISPTCVLLDGGSCATLSIEADSCENYSNSKYESTANDLKSSYKNVYKLMQDIEDAYDDLTDALKTSNEKLEKMINVTKISSYKKRSLFFYLNSTINYMAFKLVLEQNRYRKIWKRKLFQNENIDKNYQIPILLLGL